MHHPGIFNYIKQKEKEKEREQPKSNQQNHFENKEKIKYNEISLELNENLEETENDTSENKEKKLKSNLDNVDMSNKLEKQIAIKYKESNMDDVNILSYIKEYLSICIKYENHFHNSKYNVLYMMKTHKKYKDLFVKLSQTKNYDQMNEIIQEINECI